MTTEDKSKKEILVVEDNPSFRKAAKIYFGTVEGANVTYAVDYNDAQKKIGDHEYDGGLVDCFFPKKTGSEEKDLGWSAIENLKWGLNLDGYDCTKEEYMAPIVEALKESENAQPLGINIARRLELKEIPFILATSEYHHGKLAGPICMYQRIMGWPEIIDKAEATKDQPDFWRAAYEGLLIQMAKS